MKGVVFTEFLEFVELQAGYDVVDQMIVAADTPSGGVYSATGKYKFAEMASLVTELSRILNAPVPDLLRGFGKYLMGRFVTSYPQFFAHETDCLDLLEKIENYVHVEVKKLYPDAELPTLEVSRVNRDEVQVNYVSCRPLGDLCLGLIEGCAQHFNQDVVLSVAKTDDGLKIGVVRMQREAA